MYDRNCGARQVHARVELRDCRIVPVLDLARIYVGEQRTCQFQLSGANSGNVDHRNNATDDNRELREIALRKIIARERLVGCAEVDRPRLHLRNAAAGADRLVVHRCAALSLVVGRPGGKHRVDECGPCAGNLDAARAARAALVVRVAGGKERCDWQREQNLLHGSTPPFLLA